MLRVDLSPSGLERVEASSGHDDLADALMLALTPLPRPRRALALRPRRPGRPADAPPEAALPPEARGFPTVATGGGLRIPRTPILQSVGGPELTVPPGLEVRDRDPKLAALRARVARAITHQRRAPRWR